jgi:hypothetical protein
MGFFSNLLEYKERDATDRDASLHHNGRVVRCRCGNKFITHRHRSQCFGCGRIVTVSTRGRIGAKGILFGFICRNL